MTHFTCERGVGLLIELACTKGSVLSFACAESRACYIGVHGSLEKTNTQDRIVNLANQVMQKLTMTRSVSDRELGEVLDPSKAASIRSGDRRRRSYCQILSLDLPP